MTDLNDHLIKLIKLHGPITVSNYMTEALTNPKYGYYVNQNPFGKHGDFITAPEVSQMFGEMIGLWFADLWIKMSRPGKVHLIELGPGNGTLMADIVRVFDAVPALLNSIELHFVEAAPQLIEIQKEKFREFKGKKNWHETVKSALSASKAEDETTFIIANEFLDALPIRQFQKGDLGWHERMVTVSTDGNHLINMLSPFPVQDVKLPEHLINAEQHSIIEISPMAEYLIAQIADHFKSQNGAALFIDYGYTAYQTGETLQAVEKHKYADVFSRPGHADLSAHVNFKKLIDIVEKTGIKSLGPIHQGKFLNNMGIEERVSMLCEYASLEQKKDILGGLNRLIAPDEMGTLFKVMGLMSRTDIDVAGF